MKHPVYLHKPGMVCALGNTTAEIADHLFSSPAKPLSMSDRFRPGAPIPVGEVTGKLPDIETLPLEHRSRNNQLLMAAYQQIETQVQRQVNSVPAHRVGIVIGTSTSGIGQAESAFESLFHFGGLPTDFRYTQQEIGAPAQFLAQHLGFAGPATTISTACSSSGKALAIARRLINADICDVVICGGVDSLCKLTINGFSALNSVSASPCNPFSKNRDGINIGEASCLFIASRNRSPVLLSGCGESSDAHHISAPHPDGTGAIAAMRSALNEAGIDPAQVDYINLHGTATPQNDSVESLAVNTVFGARIPCSSTKPLTGHTLGAAGAIEAGFCWLTLNANGVLPPHWWDQEKDETLSPITLVDTGVQLRASPQHVLSNSFAFGGNNISLLLTATEGTAT